MKFECYSHWRQLPASVDSLFEHCGKTSMFFTREWFETLYATAFEDGQPLLLATVVEEDCVMALLPLIETSYIETNDFKARHHEASRDKNCQSFNHRYTALYSLLLAKEKQTEVLDCFVEGLNHQHIYSLQLSPVAEDDNNLLLLQKALEPSGYETHRHFFFYNWIYRTHGQSFDEYLAERPAQLRNTIARKRRKLEREQEYKIRLFKGDEVQDGLKDYHAAYSASWKAYEQYVTLLDSMAVNLSVPGWTRLAVLYIDGNAAAAQLWFVVHGKASIFRLAYNEEWKQYSPGSILTAYLMQHVIDIDKVEEIDFLTGNEKYKQDWMSERRQRCRLLFVKQHKPRNDSGGLISMLMIAFKRLFNIRIS